MHELRLDIESGISLPEEIERACVRSLLESPDERVFFKDLESRLVMVSAGFLAAVAPGRTLEEVLGKTDFDLFSGPHAAAAFDDLTMTGRDQLLTEQGPADWPNAFRISRVE